MAMLCVLSPSFATLGSVCDLLPVYSYDWAMLLAILTAFMASAWITFTAGASTFRKAIIFALAWYAIAFQLFLSSLMPSPRPNIFIF